MTLETKQLETKAGGDTPEVRAAMHDFLNAFEDFKSANDERLSELEGKSREDVVLSEKVARINAALDEQKSAIDRLLLDRQRSSRGGAEPARPDERKHAFERYVRTGDASRMLEEKALSVGSDPDGGYLAPDETERLINAAVRDISPIRQIATVRQIGASSYRKPVSTTGMAAGWVGETGDRTQTATSTLAAVDFPTMELYAMPATTQALLDDSIVDLERWIADEVQTEFAAQEGAAFVAGDGTNKPRGFLDYDKVAEGSWAWNKIGYIATGADGAFGTNPMDALIDLIYAPKQAFRANGRFVMNRSVVGQLRKFRDGDGNYLWQPSVQAGAPATLMGYPVTEAEEMEDVASDSFSIAFGDFARGYLIVDRVGIRVLRDPFSAKPYVLFYTTKRVGGGVQHFDAIKLLKFGTA
ncbi:phage major capsid protein [Aquisalinus flavus]|uniref:Phage capsid protein n=1 Tax=Aquisalinus flavus TaxID=1526572 RepID=A0A8J2V4I7_9PROT|nr:phage major capsid protein [Aquisalinus flavus]MBD0426284.1 phage major capsid protein [Aquisalinus flavus]UNE48147.1 phage major capsid protein [Aquisalinus flavus]GGD09174.1 phage capsid protein [Aquisalinus flavus]